MASGKSTSAAPLSAAWEINSSARRRLSSFWPPTTRICARASLKFGGAGGGMVFGGYRRAWRSVPVFPEPLQKPGQDERRGCANEGKPGPIDFRPMGKDSGKPTQVGQTDADHDQHR